jgi:hypothetical protein
MARSRGLLLAIACLFCVALAPAAQGATKFHPRVGGALGLVPPLGGNGKARPADVATGPLVPAVYHAGSVMAGGVTVHTIFWAPSGYGFQPTPAGAPADYEGMIQQFFTDIAHDSGASGSCSNAECNSMSVLPQFAQGTSVGGITPGSYSISYSAPTDSINDTNPYPATSSQCASPGGIATCLTDGQISSEVDRIVQSTSGTPRGLTNLWFVFLPPSVDECITPGACGTNSFAGYHSVSSVSGHGATIYAVAIDPIIEVTIPPGADPQNYPDAEAAINVAAHETVEAMTDPKGAGWLDSNGFEVGDKCETQNGTPLGFAGNGSPYNQMINGHQYLFQEMWANAGNGGNPGCVQATTTTANPLPLPQVNLSQFNPVVTGNVNRASGGGIGVQVSLLRADVSGSTVTVAKASTTTAANGSWSVSLGLHAPGDDRDEIDVVYSGAGAPSPSREVIQTGNGGNPFTESGWMGWFAMDTGSAAASSSLSVAPCFQTGQLSVALNYVPLSESPTDACNTQTDSATVATPAVGRGGRLTWTSNDNRGFEAPEAPTPNLNGALVSLTAPVGEPGSVFCAPQSNPCAPPFSTPLSFFTAGGFPTCTADLELQEVGCTGLVPSASYTLSDGRQRASGAADSSGTIIEQFSAGRDSTVVLSNGSRTLTTLHVARLRVDIAGEQTTVADGSCQPGDYWGAPLSGPPTSAAAGIPSSADGGGSALTGAICPLGGNPVGLPTDLIAQSDELSGGLTETEVPHVLGTSPIDGESLYGKFTALAESGLLLSDNTILPTDGLTRVALEIVSSSSGASAFRASNVDTFKGVTVSGLVPGSYAAIWTLTDLNGDTRTVATRFAEQLTSGPKATVSCKLAGRLRKLIACKVSFPQLPAPTGTVRVRITRGGTVVALGRGSVKKGKATVTMRRLNVVTRGAWRITLVLSRPHKRPETVNLSPKRVI